MAVSIIRVVLPSVNLKPVVAPSIIAISLVDAELETAGSVRSNPDSLLWYWEKRAVPLVGNFEAIISPLSKVL